MEIIAVTPAVAGWTSSRIPLTFRMVVGCPTTTYIPQRQANLTQCCAREIAGEHFSSNRPRLIRFETIFRQENKSRQDCPIVGLGPVPPQQKRELGGSLYVTRMTRATENKNSLSILCESLLHREEDWRQSSRLNVKSSRPFAAGHVSVDTESCFDGKAIRTSKANHRSIAERELADHAVFGAMHGDRCKTLATSCDCRTAILQPARRANDPLDVSFPGSCKERPAVF